ncbi:hypothetical protein NCS57_01415400 [Fusarium keratoplasticum]|uniref:Uncharacterized protein n=1 Tax=Fusarium keratoplasticum TaxID=1328300 RepID=A0ACC0QF31_9HYPO|nr:hypothetical protein NCS57_01415400 [Fusarium keratoplasticum]KAI8650805.1 hypothetical protein NCS57_01415400 [Fusarium keratoplasticum]
MATTFDISPEWRASQLHFYYRQLFITPPMVSRRDADLSGKTAIVTGSNTGLGLEIARQLLDLGCKVILAVRDEAKGERALQELSNGRDLPSDFVEVWKLDMLSYESIMTFAKRVESLQHLDIAILNAGVQKAEESFLATGFEEGFQVNFLSTMLLAILLLPIIKGKTSGSSPGQICILSSDMAAWSRFQERNTTPLLSAFKQKMPKWDLMDRYCTTKLLGQLFLSELSKHVSPSDVTVSCANPGLCGDSQISREFQGTLHFAFNIYSFLFSRTCSVGARTIVNTVTTLGDQAHGQYSEDAKVQPMSPLVYKSEGLRLSKQLYEETLDELSFAGVRDIINDL